MSLTSRRRRPLDRSVPHLRDTSLVVVATEGTSTEKQYFEIFRRESSRVQVRVLETQGGRSAPRHVLERLASFRRQFDLGAGDALCLVVDKDRWPDEQLAEVAAEAGRSDFLLAVSHPCFELWLYLHLADAPDQMQGMSCRQLQAELRSVAGGYRKSALDTATFKPYVGDAVARAEALDVAPRDRWPNQLGTRVYRVILAIRERQ